MDICNAKSVQKSEVWISYSISDLISYLNTKLKYLFSFTHVHGGVNRGICNWVTMF